ncbi:MAG: OFA family MFS transporter [Deltaproteobacteria bacterium]|nr:OFA family MFS transporter [Deltaproteobacteria bacterium]MBW2644147.1 OFA family MFS transporter [Deltaproteobacteria bacterium]
MVENKTPAQAWRVVFAGTTINLCLGVLYAWSVWKVRLVNPEFMSLPMNAGWSVINHAQASTPVTLCMLIFGLLMIPGGRLQDTKGPTVAASIGGIAIGLGLILAGAMKSYTGLIIGYGIGGGIGMGIGYAAPTPAALKWFGPHKRGLVAGLVVAGYGGAALYVSPLAKWIIDSWGVSASFYFLGVLYLIVICLAAQVLAWPEEGYVPEAPPLKAGETAVAVKPPIDWTAGEMTKTWQFYALVAMFILNTQSGILIITNAAGLAKKTAAGLVAGWVLASFGGLINAAGRVGTGKYSDVIGRNNAYILNCGISAIAMLCIPYAIATKSIGLLFFLAGVGYWQYGGGLALMPSFTADFYGPKNLGFNYGLVFIGWACGAFMPRLAGMIRDATGSFNIAFYLSAALLIVAIGIAFVNKKPKHATEQ